jgi:hypothetical protein
VSVADTAHALVAPSAGVTIPLIVPALNCVKANKAAAANVNAASFNLAFFIITNYGLIKKWFTTFIAGRGLSKSSLS